MERYAQVNLLLCVKNANGYSEWEVKHAVSNIFREWFKIVCSSQLRRKTVSLKLSFIEVVNKSYKFPLSKALVILLLIANLAQYISLLLSSKCLRKATMDKWIMDSRWCPMDSVWSSFDVYLCIISWRTMFLFFQTYLSFLFFHFVVVPDHNECNAASHGCEQKCVNAYGSYSCACLRGYQLNSDNKTCSG